MSQNVDSLENVHNFSFDNFIDLGPGNHKLLVLETVVLPVRKLVAFRGGLTTRYKQKVVSVAHDASKVSSLHPDLLCWPDFDSLDLRYKPNFRLNLFCSFLIVHCLVF